MNWVTRNRNRYRNSCRNFLSLNAALWKVIKTYAKCHQTQLIINFQWYQFTEVKTVWKIQWRLFSSSYFDSSFIFLFRKRFIADEFDLSHLKLFQFVVRSYVCCMPLHCISIVDETRKIDFPVFFFIYSSHVTISTCTIRCLHTKWSAKAQCNSC